MKTYSRLLSALLILCMGLLPFSAHAGMIATEQVVANAAAQGHRDRVRDFIARADVQKQLEAFGLGTANAQVRVDALTDEEVQRIAGRIDSAPAGASTTGQWWVIVALIAVAFVVYLKWR